MSPQASRSVEPENGSGIGHWRLDVVPNNYASFFDAASQGAGALIGLLFVVIALRPGEIVGPHADSASRGLAVSSFTGLVNAFFVSLLALIPGHNIGIGAAIMAIFSLYHTLRLHLRRTGVRHVVGSSSVCLPMGSSSVWPSPLSPIGMMQTS